MYIMYAFHPQDLPPLRFLSRRCCPIAPMRDTPTRLIHVVDPSHLYL
jgi:hypothetical protein